MLLARALTFVALIPGYAPSAPPARDSALARRLTTAALDQEAELHLDSALALLRAARRADSTDVVAEFQYVALRRRRFELVALREEYAPSAAHWSTRGTFCWTPWITAFAEQRPSAAAIVRAESVAGVSSCSMVQTSLDVWQGRLVPLHTAAAAVRLFPTVPVLWTNYAQALERNSQPVRAEAAWLDGIRAVDHPLLSVQLAMLHIGMRLRVGDTLGAQALQRVVRSAVMRDGRPGTLREYLAAAIESPALAIYEGGENSIFERLVRVSAASGDWADAATALFNRGKLLIDRGEPLLALPLLSRAIVIADSVHVADLQVIVRTLRGRAYVKAGHLAEGERDLLSAVIAGELAARVYYRADAYHNLAHLYESQGRWPEASHAVDRFVDLSRPTVNGSEVASLLDAGDIRWKAGWHASADAAYREMVRAIERTHADWYYAGQFFERAGDFDRAKNYYIRSFTQTAADPAPMAGMSRVHAAMGHADSAEYWARAHDAQMVTWTPTEIPLLPAVLAKRGRTAEATRIAHDWAARQLRSGNVQGAVIATLQVAQLLLDAGRPDSALIALAQSDSIAAAFHLTREAIRARAMRGTALIRLGRADEGVRAIESALALATRHPSADLLFETHLALGDAFRATGRVDAVLREYDRAAQEVERATVRMSADVDRAGYRERNLRPFDGALRVLLNAVGRPNRTEELVRWLARRNAAALAVADGTHGDTAVSAPQVVGLAELQARLATDEALLSYIVIDSSAAAIVVTRDGARVAWLATSADALARDVEDIRRPMVTTYSGRIDLARARYPTAIAAALYATLVRPFSKELLGKRRLFVAPDGPLNALAFDALVVPSRAEDPLRAASRAALYLIDSFEVEYVPSPAFIPARGESARGQRVDGARLLAVGYEAPGSAEELQALRAVWPAARLTTIESGAATESAVKGRLASFAIIHFAVHANADTRDPLASHLRLAADAINDGYLHITEIAAARIPADLVVLSACGTNAGPVYGGEGVIGIARAFLASGAHTVVATQWPIGAETVVLMREFYTRLAKGDAPSAALRAAKLFVRRLPATANPVFWAGFVLVRGRVRPG